MLTFKSSSWGLLAFKYEVIPLTRRLGGVFLSSIELIHPTRFLWILTFHIVLNLCFWTGQVWRAFPLHHFNHDSGISTFADLPIDRKLKALVFLFGNDVSPALTS